MEMIMVTRMVLMMVPVLKIDNGLSNSGDVGVRKGGYLWRGSEMAIAMDDEGN